MGGGLWIVGRQIQGSQVTREPIRDLYFDPKTIYIVFWTKKIFLPPPPSENDIFTPLATHNF